MEQFLQSLTPTDFAMLAVGAALLFFGRRLFWLALAGLGFLIGLYLADTFLTLDSPGIHLGVAFLVGVLGAVLAVAAQKIAVSVAGILAGGLLGYQVARFLAPPEQLWTWLAMVVGALLGALLAALLFEAALIAISSLVGASLVANASPLEPPAASWLFLGLLCLGILVQGRGQPRREKPA